MTRLQGDQKLKRSLNVLGMELVATITSEGIVLKSKGGKLGVCCDWMKVISAAHTPYNCQSRFHGRPLEWLKSQAAKIQSSKAETKSRTKENIAP